MPSNYTIAKQLQRIVYYRQISGRSAGSYPGVLLEVQSLSGVRLDELYKTDWQAARQHLNEPDDEAWETLAELARGEGPSVLVEEEIPLSILELTEVKGLGPKTARRLFDELGVTNLKLLQDAITDGRIGKVKGFGPKLVEKVAEYCAKEEKKKR